MDKPQASVAAIGGAESQYNIAGYDPDDEVEEPASKIRDKAFEKVKDFYEKILKDLEDAEKLGTSFEEVKKEFSFVWSSLKKSHDNLDFLLKEDKKITLEVGDTMARTRNIIRIAENYPEKAKSLSKKLELAWNLVDVSDAEEKQNAARLEELESEIALLNRNITQAANMEGRVELNELTKIKRKLEDEKESLGKELARLNATMELIQEKKDRQIERKMEFQNMIKFSDDEAIAQNDALTREIARKEKIMRNIEITTFKISRKNIELENLEKQMSQVHTSIGEFEKHIRDQKIVNDVASREAEAAANKQEKLKSDVESQLALVERLAIDAYKRQNELEAKENEIETIKIDLQRVERQKQMNLKKCDMMQETLNSLDGEREKLRGKIQALERDLERAQKRLEHSKKEVEDLDKQRTAVNRNLQRANAAYDEHDSQIKITSVAVSKLDGELEGFRREISTQTESIKRLEKERDFYAHEATKLANVVAGKVEILKRLDAQVYDGRKVVAELEATLKANQQSYETAAAEKLYYERALKETVTEIGQCAKAIRNAKFELYSLETRDMDFNHQILTLEEQCDKLKKEAAFLRKEADRIKHLAVDTQRETEALEAERLHLSTVIASANDELAKQTYYVKTAETKKEYQLRKLMLKEITLRETWEKWRTLHSMIRIGASHYRSLIREIMEMRKLILNLRQEQLVFKGNKARIVHLKQEMAVLENNIAKETCMINSLSQALSMPINVHRWRVLEAVDPDAYDLVKKNNVASKRLIDHKEGILRQNKRILDHEHVYVDVKHMTRHIPGWEAIEEGIYQQVYFESREQLKNLKEELYVNESHANYFRKQIEDLMTQMGHLRNNYFNKCRLGRK